MAHRLGDIVDDYCSRCRLISNNSVEAMMGESVVKVRCRTCNFSHDFRNGQMPEKVKPRKTSQKSAFDQVLAAVTAGKSTGAADGSGSRKADAPKAPARREATHHGLHTLSAARKKLNK